MAKRIFSFTIKFEENEKRVKASDWVMITTRLKVRTPIDEYVIYLGLSKFTAEIIAGGIWRR